MIDFTPQIGMKVKRNVAAVSADYWKTGKIIYINRRHKFYAVEFKSTAKFWGSSKNMRPKKTYIECYKY